MKAEYCFACNTSCAKQNLPDLQLTGLGHKKTPDYYVGGYH